MKQSKMDHAQIVLCMGTLCCHNLNLELMTKARQGLAKVRVKSETQESHFMFLGLWESVRE